MNKFVLLLIFLFLFSNIKAQDRIISINHDTIQCTIVSINNERILYELKKTDGSVTGKFIKLSQITEYTRYGKLRNNLTQHNQKDVKPVNIPEHVWSMELNVGKSTMPWFLDNMQTASATPDYYNKLKTGFHINTSAHYMINKYLGMGAEYSFFNSSFSGSMQSQYSTSLYALTYEKYHQYINFLGPSVLLQQHLDKQRKFVISEAISAGTLFVRIEDQDIYPNVDQSGYTDVTINSLLTANSWAAKFGLSAEYRLSQNVSIGLGSGFIWGSFKTANYEIRGSNNTNSSLKNQELTKPINLSRIDYSLVLHYQF